MNTDHTKDTSPGKVGGIFRTMCATFPRSGHLALRDTLLAYFGERFHYCESHKTPVEFTLENNPKTNYEKNHDFNLTVPVVKWRKHLVQIRDPRAALSSWWRFKGNTFPLKNTEERRRWREHMTEGMEYYHRFFNKWIIQPVPNRLVVPYDLLVSRPLYTCRRVIKFISGEDIEYAQLVRALRVFPILKLDYRETLPYNQV
jgi:hypothetical protein